MRLKNQSRWRDLGKISQTRGTKRSRETKIGKAVSVSCLTADLLIAVDGTGVLELTLQQQLPHCDITATT